MAGRVSVGDLSELGMVNLRSIGDIATESVSSLPKDVLLEGECPELVSCSLDVAPPAAPLEPDFCE